MEKADKISVFEMRYESLLIKIFPDFSPIQIILLYSCLVIQFFSFICCFSKMRVPFIAFIEILSPHQMIF